MKLKKLSILSWAGGCAATVLTGNISYFTAGLFIGMLLFALSETIDHFFCVNP